MMSTFNGMGQRPKKGLTLSYDARSILKSRSQTTTPPVTGTPDSSHSGAQTPVKDIYDFDFVDDAPAPPTSIIKPRRLNFSQPPSSASKPKSRSTTNKSLAPSPMPASIVRPRALPGKSNGNTFCDSLDTSRGTKRKPRFQETPSQRASNVTATTSAASETPSDCSHSSKIAKKSFGLAAGPVSGTTVHKYSREIKSAQASPTRSLSPSLKQRAVKTPPPLQDSIRLESPLNAQSPVASPQRAQSSLLAITAHKAVRKTQSVHTEARSSQQLPIRPSDTHSANPAKMTPQMLHQKSATAGQETLDSQQLARHKRRRLIDTLASQIEDESSSDEESNPTKEPAEEDDDQESASSDEGADSARHRNRRGTPVGDSRGSYMDLDSLAAGSPSKASIAPSTPATITRRTAARRPGFKFTYNVERTMLAEGPVDLGGPQGSDLSLLESLLPEPEAKPTPFDLDDDMGGGSQSTIQSIHELRQAGANSRYADELLDIMDRIGAPRPGKPSSARRSALLEMMQKLQEKSFLRHFRDQGAEMQLFCAVGKETDVVAGFTIMCIMITVLANGSALHQLLRELRQQKIKDLFLFLLAFDVDIVVYARDRKANVSNYMRQQLDITKEIMKKFPAVWRPATAPPSKLSPRTACLAALHMFAQQLQSMPGGSGGLDEDDGALNAALTKELFAEVSAALSSACGDGESAAPSNMSSGLSSSNTDSVDLHISLSLLEMHSASAMQSDISAEWTLHYLPIIATALKDSLVRRQKSSLRLNDMELLILKLALNTANNNPDAARYYVDKGLLRMLAELSAGALEDVIRSAKTSKGFAPDALNELLLMLGVMINFSENDTAAGETLVQSGGLDVIDQLGRAFLDGTAISSEADSEEKSQLNVAFAYLSILLGYLCLYDPIYQAFGGLSLSGSIKPLLDSINQFIILHNQIGKAENLEHGAEASHFTARLGALTQVLATRAHS